MSKTLCLPDDLERRAVVVAGLRTPWIKAGRAFRSMSATDLATHVVRELLARHEVDPKDVDELVFGCVGPTSRESNIARVVALRAGLPASMPAVTVQRNCASGFEAVDDAARRIAAGEGTIYVVGGTESMSSYPLIYGTKMTAFFEALSRAKSKRAKAKVLASFRPSMLAPRIALVEGLTDPVCGQIMGKTAETLAADWHIERNEQDAFALRSHKLAAAARARGDFAGEISPIYMEKQAVHEDDGPRDDQSADALGKLRPFFDRREGTVTVGNACPVTDGAAALLVMSEAEAQRRGLEVLGRMRASHVAGLSPERMGLGPAHAIPFAADAAGVTKDDLSVWEINEAFASQVLACTRALDSAQFCRDVLGRSDAFGAPDDKVLNPRGGAIALGHPVGATGARLVIGLLRQLRAAGGGVGVASACVGGGQGHAQIWEVAA
ncbi:MAG: thiolase family protein [Planctomycetes bacterium]|nr:thiolase family protein [Planctomycetota bacterium]